MKYLTLICMVLSLQSFAQSESEQMYLYQCGSMKELKAFAKKTGEKITANDLKELKAQREPILNILAKGNQGLKDLLTAGGKSDTGPFGAIAACGVIKEIKPMIKAKGCYDLQTNAVIKDNGGIAACDNFLSKLPK